jgi:endo-1,4-beta-xylanase
MAKFLSKSGSFKKQLLRILVVTIITSIVVLSSVSIFASYQSGTNNGYHYFCWTNDKGTVNYQNQAGGRYTVSWNSNGTTGFNFTCGKGWSNGAEDRVVSYTGSFNPGNNGYLALYGWTTLPAGSTYQVAEYYVVESYGNWTPPGSGSDVVSLGTMTSDSGTYNMYRTTRINQPWVVNNGTGSFYQYWSIRTPKVTTGNNISGQITFQHHVDAWENAGLDVGDFSTYYQVMETEGWESTGNSDITVGTGYAVDGINICGGDGVMYIDSSTKRMGSSTTVSPTDNRAIYDMYYVDRVLVDWNNWVRYVDVVALKSRATGQYVTVENSNGQVIANSTSIGTAQKFYYQDNYNSCDFRSLLNDMSIDFSGICRGSYPGFSVTYLDLAH